MGNTDAVSRENHTGSNAAKFKQQRKKRKQQQQKQTNKRTNEQRAHYELHMRRRRMFAAAINCGTAVGVA